MGRVTVCGAVRRFVAERWRLRTHNRMRAASTRGAGFPFTVSRSPLFKFGGENARFGFSFAPRRRQDVGGGPVFSSFPRAASGGLETSDDGMGQARQEKRRAIECTRARAGLIVDHKQESRSTPRAAFPSELLPSIPA